MTAQLFSNRPVLSRILAEKFSAMNASIIVLCMGVTGCSGSGIPSQYIAAEKLWTQKNYAAAAYEFDEIAKKDADGALGLQSLYRSAQTKTLFLKKHDEARAQFEQVLEKAPNSEIGINSIREVGEIFYSRTNSCAQVLVWYQKYEEDPRLTTADHVEFLTRRARCHHRMRALDQAIVVYEGLLKRNLPPAAQSKLMIELATVYLSKGEQDTKFSDLAAKTFEKVITDFPGSEAANDATYGIANAYEQLGRLTEALAKFKQLLASGDMRNGRDQLLKVSIQRLELRIEKKSKGKTLAL